MSERIQVELATGWLTIEVREAAFPLQTLCGFAARNNRKRGFLFVSKVLGKHWPASPSLMRQIHEHLSDQLELGEGPWVFAAMAETATGLGQGVFEAVLDRHPEAEALFLHSTRYRAPGRPFLAFEEAHCHAPDQYLYEPTQAEHRERFRTARELVVIDDEISTGSTLCNLVAAYRAMSPELRRVHFVAITNFSGAGSERRFAERVGLPVRCVAALHGDFSFETGDWPDVEPAPKAVGEGTRHPGQIADELGRFGIDRPTPVPAADIERLSEGLAPGARVLVLGTGEFMHIAFRVGQRLEARGLDTVIQSTTRSPILLGGDVGGKLTFGDNYGEGIPNYLYNVDPAEYERIVVCHETPVDTLSELMYQLGPHCRAYHYAALPEPADAAARRQPLQSQPH